MRSSSLGHRLLSFPVVMIDLTVCSLDNTVCSDQVMQQYTGVAQ